MFFSSGVSSLETLQEYIENNHIHSSIVLNFITHLIEITNKIGKENITKIFLLQEAEYYSDDLDLSVRRFIAKRMYAFHRKKLFYLLEERVQYFPNNVDVPPEILAKILILEKVSSNSFIITKESSSPSNNLYEDEPEKIENENYQKIETTKRETKKSVRVRSVKTEIDYSYSSEKTDNNTNIEKSIAEKMEKQLSVYKKMKIERINIRKISKNFVKDIEKVKYPHLSKWIQKYLNQSENKQDKYTWMRLKHLVLSHEKIIQKIDTIQFIISYGLQKINILKILSEITDDKSLNNIFYDYFEKMLLQEFEQHILQLRRALECCYNKQDLITILSQYPLQETKHLEIYGLNIIAEVKEILENANDSDSFEKYSNKYFSHKENNIKKALFTSLFESPVIDRIWNAMQQAQSINDFFSCLKELQKIPETTKLANMIFQLAVTFLRAKQKISFTDFEVSLNFIPDFLRNHTIRIITRKLQLDINYKIETLLHQKMPIEKRWKKLLQLLNNEQYNGAKIKIFKYSREELLNKIQKVSGTSGDIRKLIDHELGDTDVLLKEFIIAKHSYEQEKKNKSSKSFYRDLKELIEEQNKNLSLHRPLINLLSSYGNIHLTEKDHVTGYELASSISMYYNNPTRTTITLPDNLEKNILLLLEEYINEERLRQLEKLKQD